LQHAAEAPDQIQGVWGEYLLPGLIFVPGKNNDGRDAGRRPAALVCSRETGGNEAMPPLRRRTLLGALAAPAVAAPGIARAAEPWPSRPVRLIVGYPAGASTDLCARILAEDMRARIGQPVLVENRPGGANGSLGAAAVAAAGGTLACTL